jgi:hypothetical protein
VGSVDVAKSWTDALEIVDKTIAKETQEWSEYVKIANIEPQ